MVLGAQKVGQADGERTVFRRRRLGCHHAQRQCTGVRFGWKIHRHLRRRYLSGRHAGADQESGHRHGGRTRAERIRHRLSGHSRGDDHRAPGRDFDDREGQSRRKNRHSSCRRGYRRAVFRGCCFYGRGGAAEGGLLVHRAFDRMEGRARCSLLDPARPGAGAGLAARLGGRRRLASPLRCCRPGGASCRCAFGSVDPRGGRFGGGATRSRETFSAPPPRRRGGGPRSGLHAYGRRNPQTRGKPRRVERQSRKDSGRAHGRIEDRRRGRRRGTRAGAGGEQDKERLPRQHEPRTAHADERHHRLQRDAPRGSGRHRGKMDGAGPQKNPLLGQTPSPIDQRHPRPFEDRGGAHDCFSRAGRYRADCQGRRRHRRTARGQKRQHLRVEMSARCRFDSHRSDQAAPDALQSAEQREQVHRAGKDHARDQTPRRRDGVIRRERHRHRHDTGTTRQTFRRVRPSRRIDHA